MEGLRASRFWAARHLRIHWRSLVVLGVLAGLTAGLVMAASTGARRTSTALSRLDAVTRASDAIVFTGQVQDLHPPWARLARRPEVGTLAVWDLLFGDVAGQSAVLFASDDGRWGSLIDRPVVLQGRMWNPRADEIVVDQQFAAYNGVKVGQVVPFHAYGPDQADTAGVPTGAVVPLRVVGIVRDTEEFLFTPGVMVSPAVVEHYRRQMFVLPNAMVRLAPGHGGMTALRHDVASLIAPGVPVLDLVSTARRVTTTLQVESFALWLLALTIALAGGLLVLQMLTRSVSLIGDDLPSLRALGMVRRDVVGGSLAVHALVIVGAAAIGFPLAYALSPLLPVGEGRLIDPDPGFHADWTVLGIGLAATVIVLALATTTLTLVVLRRASRSSRARTSGFTVSLRRSVPLPIGLGVSAAFDRTSGSRSIPVLPTVIGAVVGVVGVMGALTLDRGITYALNNPQLAGVTWAAEVTPPPQDLTATAVVPTLLRRVARAAPGASTAVVRRDLVDVDGVGVPAYSVLDASDRAGPITLALVSGRAPAGADEAAIGPETAQLLHVRVGDWVRLGHGVRVHLVGEALLPTDVHSEFDEGLWLTPRRFDDVVPPNTPDAPDEVVAVRFPATGGQELAAVRAAEEAAVEPNPPPNPTYGLVAALGGPNSVLGQNTEPVNVPPELTNLGDVSQLPTVLSIFLALLAVAAMSFVLVVSNRSRRVELAVLRALGLGSRDSRRIVHWQATAIVVVALIVGIPLGILVGRWGWHEVTARVPLVDVPPLALLIAVVTVPVALVLANVIAVIPARASTSWSPAEALRAE